MATSATPRRSLFGEPPHRLFCVEATHEFPWGEVFHIECSTCDYHLTEYNPDPARRTLVGAGAELGHCPSCAESAAAVA